MGAAKKNGLPSSQTLIGGGVPNRSGYTAIVLGFIIYYIPTNDGSNILEAQSHIHIRKFNCMSLIRVIASGPGGSPRGVGGTDIYQSTVDEDDGDGDDDEEEEDEHRLMNETVNNPHLAARVARVSMLSSEHLQQKQDECCETSTGNITFQV